MQGKFHTTVEEKEAIYYSELFKRGVEYDKAAIVAKILASGKSDKELTHGEIELVNEVCSYWLTKHKRYKHLNPFLAKYKRA
ncbi:hypothetical protein WA1_21215 [Scytonema hofmannii PCC 7110]|uniref:Uncharacterized protein n=1 Tax=Scytonema hofmannii PCC 7110 TaxID=128403 RepID=A0A139XCR3_9CYAN|nr:hypothetical protein [Scytonema hofmannii]KYC42484.1 hypothetical protein WA1_21215 [Scytonema hofmannii PCC 7110]